MAADLKTDNALKEACDAAMAKQKSQPNPDEWYSRLSKFLTKVKDSDRAEFADLAFQKMLWDNEAISATGLGQVNVSNVIKNKDVIEHLWHLKKANLPSEPTQRTQFLIDAWEKLELLVKPLVNGSLPRLKMYRVFASLHPGEFTTLAHVAKLIQLAKSLGINKAFGHPIVLHRRILDRLNAVLGPATPTISKQGLDRMMLPWLLYDFFVLEKGDDATVVSGVAPGEEQLKPLSADRRRRGLLSIAGSLPSIIGMIEFAKEGCKRVDLIEHIRSINPKLATSSVRLNINALIAEWGVLRVVGDELFLTPRGEALLETEEPEEVADWLLTRILGFDNLLYQLRQEPTGSKNLVSLLQRVNPGWTTGFAPKSLVSWIRGLDLAELGPDKLLRLTEKGENWASKIHWVPGKLAVIPNLSSEKDESDSESGSDDEIVRPNLDFIFQSFPSHLRFSKELIGRLDAGLWSNKRRHFAVLTGLSGSGKTVLALHYGKGLWDDPKKREAGVFTVTVQPGWHDPSALLGYVNPLNDETYIRTGFLDFLLRANSDPDHPYTVILDEMNLSHPEQYLAPLLSSMETGGDIELHAQDDEILGVPARVPYPNNLVIIGTVNMDETTHGLSDKLLDRASVIEFWDIDVNAYPGWVDSGLSELDAIKVKSVLSELVATLRPVRMHFGWRTIGDVIGYVKAASDGGAIDFNNALDHAIYSKVLPKLRGEDTPRLQKVFTDVRGILSNHKFENSLAKIEELIEDLKYLGSARFWR